VAEGRYRFNGQNLQLERNDKEGPNAIHGFVRALPWTVQQAGPGEVTFGVRLDAATYGPRGYPFSLAVEVRYRLDAEGLTCAFSVRNVGRSAAPVGVGFHPYFTVGTPLVDLAEAKIPATGYLEFNERFVPTGRVVDARGTEWDYRTYRAIGSRRFNHCYLGLERGDDGLAVASLRHPVTGTTVDVVMDPGVFRDSRVHRRCDCRCAAARPGDRADDLRDRRLQPPRMGAETTASRRYLHRPIPGDCLSGLRQVAGFSVVGLSRLRRPAWFDNAEPHFIDLGIGRCLLSRE
jgi:hypothetical protein